MKKTIEHQGVIEVTLNTSYSDYYLQVDHEEAVCQIRRHIDNVACVNIKHDYEDICDSCESTWSEEVTYFNGGCCDEDLKGEPLCTLNRAEAGAFHV